MKIKKYCKKCKAWLKIDNLLSCLFGCRQARLVTENDLIIPFDEKLCPFPETKKALKAIQKLSKGEKYLLIYGKLPCPLCEGDGCIECNNKGDVDSFKNTNTKYGKIYMISKEVRKLRNIFQCIDDLKSEKGERINYYFSLLNIELIEYGNIVEGVKNV